MPVPLEPAGGGKINLADYNALQELANANEQRINELEAKVEAFLATGGGGGGTGDVTTAQLDAAVADLQADINTKRASALRVLFPVRFVSGAWEYPTLAAATAAGMGPDDSALFIGNPGGASAAWFRNDRDLYTEGG